MQKNAAQTTLNDLRKKIDEIDEAMHHLLMKRSEVIEQLIQTKKSSPDAPLSAFRPDREATMIQALISRHKGSLPIETVIQVWRDIISTFTYLQAPYTLHIQNLKNPTVREIIRAMYGFVVPLKEETTAKKVISAIHNNPQDLGFILYECKTPWWTALEKPTAPKIVAVLPNFTNTLAKAQIAGFVIGSHFIPSSGLTTHYYSVQCTLKPNAKLPQNTVFSIFGKQRTYLLLKQNSALDDKNIKSTLANFVAKVHSVNLVGYALENYWCDT